MKKVRNPFMYIIIIALVILSCIMVYCNKYYFEDVHNYKGYKLDLKMSSAKEKIFILVLENDSIYITIQLPVDDSTYIQYKEGDIIE